MSKRRHNAAGETKRYDDSQSTTEQLTQEVRELKSVLERVIKRSEAESNWTEIAAKWTIKNVFVAVMSVFVAVVLFFLDHPVSKSPYLKTPEESQSAKAVTQQRNEPVDLPLTPPTNTKAGSSLSQRGDKKSTLRPPARPSEDRPPILLSVGDNGRVGLRSALRGMSSFIGKNHYAVVTPPNGTDWVTPISVGGDGKLRGDPQFGEGNVGIGDSFMVRVLATDSLLSSGTLSVIPADAILSDPIVVSRQL